MTSVGARVPVSRVSTDVLTTRLAVSEGPTGSAPGRAPPRHTKCACGRTLTDHRSLRIVCTCRVPYGISREGREQVVIARALAAPAPPGPRSVSIRHIHVHVRASKPTAHDQSVGLVPRCFVSSFCDSVWQQQAACEFFTYGSYRGPRLRRCAPPPVRWRCALTTLSSCGQSAGGVRSYSIVTRTCNGLFDAEAVGSGEQARYLVEVPPRENYRPEISAVWSRVHRVHTT